MKKYIFLVDSAHDFSFFINLFHKKKPLLIITTSIMYNAVKYNFPNTNVIKILYFDLNEDKIKKNYLVLKNIFKLIINFFKIFFKLILIKLKFKNVMVIFSSGLYSLHIMQAAAIAKMFKFNILRKVIESGQSHKDEAVSFDHKNLKIYEFFTFSKIIPTNCFIKRDILFTTDIKYKKIKSIKNYLHSYFDFLDNKFNSFKNKKSILIFDDAIGRLADDYRFKFDIDFDKTLLNLEFFFQKKKKEGYFIYIKKRPDHYYYDGQYFCDLIKNSDFYEIDRYMPGEFLLKYFKSSYAIASYQLTRVHSITNKSKKHSNDLSHIIARKNK